MGREESLGTGTRSFTSPFPSVEACETNFALSKNKVNVLFHESSVFFQLSSNQRPFRPGFFIYKANVNDNSSYLFRAMRSHQALCVSLHSSQILEHNSYLLLCVEDNSCRGLRFLNANSGSMSCFCRNHRSSLISEIPGCTLGSST